MKTMYLVWKSSNYFVYLKKVSAFLPLFRKLLTISSYATLSDMLENSPN